MKVPFKPGTLIYPLPALMVSCGDCAENYNIITVAWTGTICSDPPMCYISVRKERHSHKLIMDSGEFVLNLTTEALAKATDWCGVRSGKDYKKFKEILIEFKKYYGIAIEHRMQGSGSKRTWLARYVHCKRGSCKRR